jgi:glyoxylase I family protein
MIRGIHHVALHTPNFDKMVKFYKDAFGFEPATSQISWKNSPVVDAIVGLKGSAARMQMLKAGNCFLELFEYTAPEGGRKDPPLRPHDHGYTHFCVDVTGIAEEYTRLKALGMTFMNPEPVVAGDTLTVYGKDPDGNLIEIQEVTPDNYFSFETLTGQPPRQTRP